MPKEIKCKTCGKVFEPPAKGRFARKYCDKCSADNKNIGIIFIT